MLKRICLLTAIAALPLAVACNSKTDSTGAAGQKPAEQQAAAPANSPRDDGSRPADHKSGLAEPPPAAPEQRAAATDTPAAATEAKSGNPLSRLFSREPEYREVTLPAGTLLPLELQTSVGSDTSNVEDPVRATVRRAIVIDGLEVVPAGSTMSGVVTEAARSGRVKGRARIAFRFNSLHARDDRFDVRTSAVARTAPATKKQDAAKIGIGAGAGAVIGGIVGGGSGAAKGAAIGGAGGTGVVLATRGKEVRLGPGANVAVRLLEPITVRVPLKK